LRQITEYRSETEVASNWTANPCQRGKPSLLQHTLCLRYLWTWKSI